MEEVCERINNLLSAKVGSIQEKEADLEKFKKSVKSFDD